MGYINNEAIHWTSKVYDLFISNSGKHGHANSAENGLQCMEPSVHLVSITQIFFN